MSRDGIELPVPKLSFDLLIALIEAAPNVVAIDTLMERVWPTLVVSPETVSQRVKLLRDALDDDAKQPRYIAGVRGRGYRLIAQVAVDGDDQETTTAVAAAPPGSKSRRMRFAALAAVAALVFFTIAIMVELRRESATDAPAIAPSGATTAAPERSIAVLPFANLSGSGENDVMALGIAETLLHRLASLRQITVIARTSSFAFRDGAKDPRAIGRQLNVRYLLEGSVQSDAQRLRVTAQLIDARTSAHVWSMQFDRTRGDVFAVQDEIALQVAKALEVTLDPRLTEQLTGQGTNDFEAYLAFMQARALLTTLRMDDLRSAAAHLERAIGRDPRFASAYVLLAGTQVLLAEYEITGDRQAQFEKALERGYSLLDKALDLDGTNAEAFVQRGYLNAFSDLAAAEADYRRGVELQPNNARAYEGLAAVLFQDPTRMREAEQMLDRARGLDPLEPRYDVTQAKLLFYGRGDCQGADPLLKSALTKNPLFQPALSLLAELQWACFGRFADGINYGEQALALDPRSEWTSRLLVRAYLDVGDVAAAASVLGPNADSLRYLPLHVYRHEWKLAAEAAYRALRDHASTELEQELVSLAIRKEARATGNYEQAIEALEMWSGVTWDAEGNPLLSQQLGLRAAEVGLADMLLQSGDQRRGRALLASLIAQIDYEVHDLGRGALWYSHTWPAALAMLGQTDAALTQMERLMDLRAHAWWHLNMDPAYESLLAHERFKRALDKLGTHATAEYARLQQMRANGDIPDRLKRSR